MSKLSNADIGFVLARFDKAACELIEACAAVNDLQPSELSEKDKAEIVQKFNDELGMDDYSPPELHLYGRNFDDADDVVSKIFSEV